MPLRANATNRSANRVGSGNRHRTAQRNTNTRAVS